MDGGLAIRETAEGLYVKVRVTPRSSRDAAAGVQNGALRVKLCAPPVEGAANKSVTEFLARLLGVAKGRVSLASGASSRDKTLFVEAADPAERRIFAERLRALAGS